MKTEEFIERKMYNSHIIHATCRTVGSRKEKKLSLLIDWPSFFIVCFNIFNTHSQRPVIKGPYLDQRLLLHESLFPIGLILARIEILHDGHFFTK